GLGFLQKPDDLLFRKALLHVRLLLRKRTLLDSGWPCLQGAGHLQDSAKHGTIQPSTSMSLSDYQAALGSTRDKWIKQ
ncbi:hypothetical protein KTF21_29915, partial [Burkholderia multivorans]|uniref:hypothetical protein n=1 Tax=Burkholderia multivorans TaxID=87883 RepID=UPI001C243AA4